MSEDAIRCQIRYKPGDIATKDRIDAYLWRNDILPIVSSDDPRAAFRSINCTPTQLQEIKRIQGVTLADKETRFSHDTSAR